MEEKEEAALRLNFAKITERIHPQQMCIHLVQAGILLPHQIEEINAEKTRTDKAMMLMTFIFRSGSPKTYTEFMEALKNVGGNEELFEDIGKKCSSLRRKSLQRQTHLELPHEDKERNLLQTTNNLNISEPNNSVDLNDNQSCHGSNILKPENHDSLELSSFGTNDSCESVQYTTPKCSDSMPPCSQYAAHKMPDESFSTGFTLPEFNSNLSTNCDGYPDRSSEIKLCTRAPGDVESQKEEVSLVKKKNNKGESASHRSSPVTQCHTVFYVYIDLKEDNLGIIVQPEEKGFPKQFTCTVEEIEENSVPHHSYNSIRKGDILIAVNGLEIKRNHFISKERTNLDYKKFLTSCSDESLKFTVKRKGNQIWRKCRVSLNSSHKPYGIRFANGQDRERYPNDQDIYICFVKSASPAQHAGICERDTVFAINGVRCESIDYVTDILKNHTGEVEMTIIRESWEVFL